MILRFCASARALRHGRVELVGGADSIGELPDWPALAIAGGRAPLEAPGQHALHIAHGAMQRCGDAYLRLAHTHVVRPDGRWLTSLTRPQSTIR